MICPDCRRQNPPDNAFCGGCGGRLAVICPSCERPNLPDHAYCGSCGQLMRLGDATKAPQREPTSYTPKHLAEKILTSRSALEGERKQVTVLMADVKDSLELAEALDPEDWHTILDGFFRLMADGIHRFEGTVNQFTGDGIMALFGAPIAHESHAQRACYAALHLSERLTQYADKLRAERGVEFVVRIGLNSGEVIVGKIGDDLRMDYTAQGHTVGLAARLESLASPGRACLSEDTAARVTGFFELADLGLQQFKGVSEPVRVYALAGLGPIRTRFDLSRQRGFSQFVDRTRELQALEGALERVLEGKGQAVGVVGQIGVGKTRLCDEFVERCRARGIRVIQGRTVPQGRGMSFLPVLELLRDYFDLREGGPAEEARVKIAGKVTLADPSLEEALPLLFEFMGVPDPERPAPEMEAATQKRRLFGALRQLIQADARREPLVITLGDLQWLDRGSADFLEAMLGTPVLLLTTYRPEYRAPWMSHSSYHQLSLLPLGATALEEMIADLLGKDPSVVELGKLLRERTGGNPFFIEELLLSLVESGALVGARGDHRLVRHVDQLEIPESVRTVLGGRIDRLSSREKAVLDAAAVVGETFSERLIASVVELPDAELVDALRALTDSEFIEELALYPEAEYAFKNPLTREVAYYAQLADRRARAHMIVAAAIGDLNRESIEPHAALLANHWEKAGDPWRAAQWRARAARRVVATDPGDATRHWLSLRTLLDDVPASSEADALRVEACEHVLDLGWHLGLADEALAEIFEEGRALAEANDDPTALAELHRAYGLSRLVAGSVEDSTRWFQRAVELADQADDAGLHAALRTSLILSHVWAGRLELALADTESLLAHTRDDLWRGYDHLGYSPYVWATFIRGMLLVRMGRLAAAQEEFERARQLAERHEDTFSLGHTQHHQALLATVCGDAARARAHALEAIETFEGLGRSSQTAYGFMRLGAAELLDGNHEQARQALERALQIATDHRLGVFEAEIVAYLARAQLGLGELELARTLADRALDTARARGTRLYECDALLAQARVLRGSGSAEDRVRAANVLGDLAKLVDQIGARSQRPLILLERAELAKIEGDTVGWRRELREARQLFADMGASAHADRLAAE